mmetsp:Transcript_106416/g.299633  ORF Transcript_106416/g.299633 Transcript_106416/m.299633 type:complete len:601 (+) Transcript_106416:561-2363(+)
MCPRNVARSLLGSRRISLVATHLFHGELALTTQSRQLALHVRPPSPAEAVLGPGSDEVGRKTVRLANTRLTVAVVVSNDVPTLIQFRKNPLERPQHYEVRVHVDATVVVQNGGADKVRLRSCIRQPEPLLGCIRDERFDVGVVHQDDFRARRGVAAPSLEVQRHEGVGAIRVVPKGEDLARHRLRAIRLLLLFLRRRRLENRLRGLHRTLRRLLKGSLGWFFLCLRFRQGTPVHLGEQPVVLEDNIPVLNMRLERGKEQVVRDAPEKIGEDPVLLAPIALCAVDVARHQLRARKVHLVVLWTRRVGRDLRDGIPGLPIDFAVEVRGHPLTAAEAIQLRFIGQRGRFLIALRHRGEDLRRLGPALEGIVGLGLPVQVPPLRRVHAACVRLRVGVPARELEPLEVRPGDVAFPCFRGHEGLVATDLLHQELALATYPRQLLPHVLPPSLVEEVALLPGDEVGGEAVIRPAIAALPVVVGVGDDVPTGIQLLKYVIQVAEHDEVGVHVKPTLVVQDGCADEVRLRRSIRQLKELLWEVWHERTDVGIVDLHNLCARRRVQDPSFEVEGDEGVRASWVVPVSEDLISSALLLRRCGRIEQARGR